MSSSDWKSNNILHDRSVPKFEKYCTLGETEFFPHWSAQFFDQVSTLRATVPFWKEISFGKAEASSLPSQISQKADTMVMGNLFFSLQPFGIFPKKDYLPQTVFDNQPSTFADFTFQLSFVNDR